MESRALHALELPGVLSYLAGFTVSDAGFQAALALRPLPSLAAVREASRLFEQGRLWVLRTQTRLTSFPALGGLLQVLALPSSVLDLDELFSLRQVLAQGREITAAMLSEPAAADPAGWPLWEARCRNLVLPVKSLAALGRCLSEDGNIRDEASPELSLVRGELRRLHQQCARKVKEYATEYNILHFLQDTFMTLSSDRYVLPLKANFKGRLQGVIHEYSRTGETCYFEPLFLVEINNRLQELKREERDEERKIMLYLTGIARDEQFSIQNLHTFLVDVDLLCARAALAACFDGRMAEFAPDRGLFLRGARHPLLALAASDEAGKALRRFVRRNNGQTAGPGGDGELPDIPDAEEKAACRPGKVVASTLELLPGQRALVISGGNAGGKSVCLKSVGLITLMSLCALPTPVEPGSVLPLWATVDAFIGDEQSLEDRLSTFTAQIAHLGRIWSGLSSGSLVILDEFGAGTDPSQGAALAQAVVDCIMESGAYVIAATHFPALKAYALSTEGVRAASVLFDPTTKKPLFRLAYDQVGASQALDVAREHGLPESVLRRAEHYLLMSGEDSSSLVERLNALAVAREKELAVLAGEREAFSEKKRKLRDSFERERSRLFDTVQDEVRKVLADWKAAKVSHKQALKELARSRAALLAARDPAAEGETAARPEVDLSALEPRRRVRHIPWKRTGVVVEVDARKKRVRLDFDGVSLWADATDIALPETAGTGKKITGASVSSVPAVNAGISSSVLPLRLDLRGLRADVAISDLEKFLDGAILSARDEVEVIHGRGTGVLRREIHAFLRNFSPVREFRLAPEDQGGDGVTIVGLK